MKVSPMRVADRKEILLPKISDVPSSGREPLVFRADKPDGLIGVHSALMAGALRPGENIRYLLYAPLRTAQNGPFGISAEPGSHALAVTDDRFLLSKNPHVAGFSPAVQTIPFHSVICIEIGSALLLGWLVIRFMEGGQLSCASLFYTVRGSHHFEKAVREFRKIRGKTGIFSNDATALWAEIWQRTPASQADLLKPVILDDEEPSYWLRSTETWGGDNRCRKRVCLAPAGVFLVTNYGFLHAVEEVRRNPRMHSYGVNVVCIPPGTAHIAGPDAVPPPDALQHVLKLNMGARGARIHYDIPFEADQKGTVEDLMRAFGSLNE